MISGTGADEKAVPSPAPLVSIIICAFNAGAYLEECLDSVFDQTYFDFETVIVNDGSTDDTQSIIERYHSRFSMKMIPVVQENRGVSAARNRGLDAARGKYISFLDSDDTISPDFLSRMVENAEKNEAQVVSCGFDKVLDNAVVASYKPTDWNVCLRGECYSLMVVPCARLYRRDFLDRFGLRFCENEIFEDVAFSLCVNFLAERISVVLFQGYRYRIHENSTMGKARKGMIPPEKLPFRGLDQAVAKVETEISGKDRHDAFEFAFIKALAGVLFQVLRKNDRQTIKAMAEFCVSVTGRHFPHLMKNRHISIRHIKGFPYIQSLAMVVFKFACRLRVLYPVAYLVTRL